MKKVLLFTLGVVLIFSSCRRNTGPDCCPPVDPIGSIEVHLNHMWGQDTIVRNSKRYVTAFGDTVTFSEIKGLLSGFTLQSSDGTTLPLGQVQYYKLSNSLSNSFVLTGIPDDAFQKIEFFMGLDSATNHSDVTTYPKSSALSTYQAGGDMHWNWADGFIFTNLTGNYRSPNSSRFKGFSYHLGMDANLVKFSLPTPGLVVTGNSRLIELNLNWKEIFESPHLISISNQDVTHSTSGDTLASNLSSNMKDMVQIGSIK